jgi:Tfp pilus assembly protein FimT
MKRILLGAAAIAMLAISSCKKDDDNNNSTPSNQWKVGSTTYTASAGGVNNNSAGLTATDVSQGGNSIAFVFSGSGLPTAGTYTVSNNTSGTGKVAVVATDVASNGAYTVTSGTVTVTVNSGKVAINLPSSPAIYAGMTTKPDAQVSANISQ